MTFICAQCLWKSFANPSRQSVRHKSSVIRVVQPILHFDRHLPRLVPTTPVGDQPHHTVEWDYRPDAAAVRDAARLRAERLSRSDMRDVKATGRARRKKLQVAESHGKNASVAHPLHLLRAMLRECTYLPDEVVGRHIKQYIIDRFRRKAMREGTSETPKKIYQNIATYMGRARKGLTQLQFANLGRQEPYARLLLMGYGRVGKRRRELLDELRRKDDSDRGEFNFVQDAVDKAEAKLPPDYKMPVIGPRLYAILKSQERHSAAHTHARFSLKKLKYDPPKKTIWNEELSRKRQANLVDDWYKNLLDAVLPPLPESEHTYMQAIATGTSREHMQRKKRRPRARLSSATDEINFVGYEFNHQNDDDAYMPSQELRDQETQLTLRFTRRRSHLVFDLCPRLTPMPDNKWQVTWAKIGHKLEDQTSYSIDVPELDVDAGSRSKRPQQETWAEVEKGLPEGDARSEIVEFLKEFQVRSRFPPEVPQQKSSNFGLPRDLARETMRLIDGRPKPEKHSAPATRQHAATSTRT